MSQSAMSITGIPLRVPIAAALGGTVVGYLLGLLKDIQQEKRRISNSGRRCMRNSKSVHG